MSAHPGAGCGVGRRGRRVVDRVEVAVVALRDERVEHGGVERALRAPPALHRALDETERVGRHHDRRARRRVEARHLAVGDEPTPPRFEVVETIARPRRGTARGATSSDATTITWAVVPMTRNSSSAATAAASCGWSCGVRLRAASAALLLLRLRAGTAARGRTRRRRCRRRCGRLVVESDGDDGAACTTAIVPVRTTAAPDGGARGDPAGPVEPVCGGLRLVWSAQSSRLTSAAARVVVTCGLNPSFVRKP